MIPSRAWPLRTLALALCAILCAAVLWQVASGLGGSAATTGSPAAASQLALASPTLDSTLLGGSDPPASAGATSGTSATPIATPTAAATPTRRATAGPTRTDHPWAPDPNLVLAKNAGRVTVDSSGRVTISPSAPTTPAYATAKSLPTSWSGLIQEPPKTGRDDRGVAYTDNNYILFCGPGTGTVILYYWPASSGEVKSRSGTFREPVNVGANRYAGTYWKAQDAAGYGRGMIAYLAEVEWPAPDKGLSWWSRPGVMRWSSHPATYVENLVDAINWEASGHTRLDYFYVIVHASDLTAAALLDHVHADIGMGVPVVIAARTSDGTNSLPFWKVKSKKSAGNHFVTVLGYDDSAGTYTVMDTCGLTCNDRNVRAGVKTMSQQALYALIAAESDNDGIMW